MRTTFSEEIDGASKSRTFSAQPAAEANGREAKFPFTVKHRHAKVKIYCKSAKYPFSRIAYRAEGGRVVRSFKTYGEAKMEAKRAAKQIAAGKESVAKLPVRDALAYKFAMEKVAELRAELNARKPDFTAPDFSLSLEDAITEFAEAKRALGPRRLVEAVKGYLSTVAQVRRVPVRQAANEYLADRDRLPVARAAGKRPALSPKLAYQDRLRLERFASANICDVCDLTKDHFDLLCFNHLPAGSPVRLWERIGR